MTENNSVHATRQINRQTKLLWDSNSSYLIDVRSMQEYFSCSWPQLYVEVTDSGDKGSFNALGKQDE